MNKEKAKNSNENNSKRNNPMRNSKNSAIAIVLMIAICIACVSVAHAATTDSLASSVSFGLVNQNPSPAAAGDIVEVRIGIQNIGASDTGDLVMEVVPSFPFTIASGDSITEDVGIVSGYQGYYDTSNQKIVKFRILVDKNAVASTYDLKLKYYEKGSLDSAQATVPIDVSTKESAEIIHIDKTVLIPGQQSELKFSINNVGNAPLKDLTFSWTNDGNIILPVGSDNTRYINEIDVGGSAELDYQVIADTNAQAGLYKLDLGLSYYNSLNNSQKTISTIAGVYVGGGTDFEVAYSDSSSGTTSFTIANIGSNPASSVSVIIPNQPGWRVTGSSSAIIGNLNKGDYTVASFKLASTASANQSRTFNRSNAAVNGNGNFNNQNNVNINDTVNNATGAGVPGLGFRGLNANNTANVVRMQIAYTDTMGNRNVLDKTVNIASSNSASGTATGGTTSGSFAGRTTQNQSFLSKYQTYIIILVVLGVAGFFIYRRQKSKKMKLLHPTTAPKTKDILKGTNK